MPRYPRTRVKMTRRNTLCCCDYAQKPQHKNKNDKEGIPHAAVTMPTYPCTRINDKEGYPMLL